MIYLSKRGTPTPVVYWGNGGVWPDEWAISNTLATNNTGLASKGNGVLHGPLLAEGTYVDVFLHSGYTSMASPTNVSFLGATSSYGSFSYGDTNKNYAAVYWSGSQFVNGTNIGGSFQVNGNTYYRISRTAGSNPGVNTRIRVSKIDISGNVTVAGTDMTINYNNAMHVVLLGQAGYNNSSITWIRSGTL